MTHSQGIYILKFYNAGDKGKIQKVSMEKNRSHKKI